MVICDIQCGIMSLCHSWSLIFGIYHLFLLQLYVVNIPTATFIGISIGVVIAIYKYRYIDDYSIPPKQKLLIVAIFFPILSVCYFL